LIRFAILSDLHIKIKDDIQNKVLENIIEFFDQEIAEGNKIDLVFISGDITESGDWNEFEIAINFFQRLQASLNISSDNFFIIPGNHDYDKKIIGTAYKYIEKPNLSIYQEIFRSKDFDKHIKTAYNNFRKAIRKFYGSSKNIISDNSNLNIADSEYQIIVINSSLANTIGNDKLKSFVDIEEIKPLVKKRENFDLSIVLMHHPPDNFYVGNKKLIDEFLVSHCDLLITGHEHYPNYGKRGRLEGQEYLLITNGSVYLPEERNPEQYSFRFSIVEHNLSTNEIIINPWHTNRFMKHCGRDTSLYPEAKETGIIRYILNHREENLSINLEGDPLKRIELDKELKEFFRNRLIDLTKVNDVNSLKKIRSDLKDIKNIELKDLCLSFLKYLITEETLHTYEDFKDTLSNHFIFQYIKRFHGYLLDYYNESYFECRKKDENITKKIIQRGKQRDTEKLIEQLTIAKEKIIEFEKKNISVIESYSHNKIELLPPLEEELQDPEAHLDWYRYFNLIGDPFPSNEGLENIDDNLFDKIIFETATIKKYRNYIVTEGGLTNLINKTFGIYGSFGSGKTTLFQYMEKLLKIHHKDVLFISIPLEARTSTEEIKKRFFIRLNRILSILHFENYDFVPSNSDLEENCFTMLDTFAKNDMKALFIIIEDIYKESGRRQYIEEVAGFIETLQTYKRMFSKNVIPTSFFFSCIEEVVDKIRGDSSKEGSVDFYDRMPAITLDNALEMINKRLKAFTKDPDNFTPISKEYLTRLRNITIQRGTPVKTFRKYIEILLERFRRLEFTEESITIQYDEETIKTLRKDIESKHKKLHKSFVKLQEISKSNISNFEKFINILQRMWLGEQIIEGKGEYISIKLYLIHLKDVDLIQKVYYHNDLGWTLSNSANNYFDKINNAYGGLNPTNIIPSIYFTENTISGPTDKTLLNLENIIKQGEEYGATFLELLKEGMNGYQELKHLSQSIDILK